MPKGLQVVVNKDATPEMTQAEIQWLNEFKETGDLRASASKVYNLSGRPLDRQLTVVKKRFRHIIEKYYRDRQEEWGDRVRDLVEKGMERMEQALEDEETKPADVLNITKTLAEWASWAKKDLNINVKHQYAEMMKDLTDDAKTDNK